jgi:hypothetical protein
MLKKKVDKAFSILERINQENEEDKDKLEKEKINKTNYKKNCKKDNTLTLNNQLNESYQLKTNNQINDDKLQKIISNPEFYIQLMSFLLFIKHKYPYELKALKYFLTSYEPIEERVMLAYLYFWFAIHMYLVSQSIPSIKYK